MNRFEKGLLTVFFLELFIGGGGRLLEFGPLSIRQVIFLTLIATYVTRIFYTKSFFNSNVNLFISKKYATYSVYALLFWFVVSSIIGILNQHSFSIIMMDFLRVSFLGLYFPLAYYISEERFKLSWVINLLKIATLIIAIFTIGIDVTGRFILKDNFNEFYIAINNAFPNELFFRPSRGVFYKGHFFLLFGLIISTNQWLNRKQTKLDMVNVVLAIVSIIWSETRGLLIGYMVAIFFIALLDYKVLLTPIIGFFNRLKAMVSKPNRKKLILYFCILISVPLLYQNMTLSRFNDMPLASNQTNSTHKKNSKVNDVSINARLYLLQASKDIVLEKPQNMIIGNGYGTKIGDRIDGIEMSFIDILVEQGLVGVLLWLNLCLLPFIYYFKVYKKEKRLLYTQISLLACVVAMVLLTNINPFLNSPIGLGFLLFVIADAMNSKASFSSKFDKVEGVK